MDVEIGHGTCFANGMLARVTEQKLKMCLHSLLWHLVLQLLSEESMPRVAPAPPPPGLQNETYGTDSNPV